MTEEEKAQSWWWRMDYCKNNFLPAAQAWAWDRSGEEYKKYLMEKKTKIKKALYRQKPQAIYQNKEGDLSIYSTEVEIDGSKKEVIFKIPESELVDEDGNHIFAEVESAQLLIRWLE